MRSARSELYQHWGDKRAPGGNRRNSDVCDKNTRRGGGRSPNTSQSIPAAPIRPIPSPIRGTKINSPDPALTAVCTPYPTPPFLPIFHPPIELGSPRPHGRLHLDRWIDFSAICFGTLLHLVVAEIHIELTVML